MPDKKNIDANKQETQPQDKFAEERLSDEKLDNVAGGNGGKIGTGGKIIRPEEPLRSTGKYRP